jgi:WhiB family transcriptional regulator, redox-sensing transcriptional regulator
MNATMLRAQLADPADPAGEHHRQADQWVGTLGEFWSWRAEASCRDLDSSIFFSPDGERGHKRRRREAAAKAVCARCPVQDACADYALANREPYGVWGGLSEAEREAIWRGRRRRLAAQPRKSA